MGATSLCFLLDPSATMRLSAKTHSLPFGFHEQRSCTVLFTLEIDIAQFLVILF